MFRNSPDSTGQALKETIRPLKNNLKSLIINEIFEKGRNVFVGLDDDLAGSIEFFQHRSYSLNDSIIKISNFVNLKSAVFIVETMENSEPDYYENIDAE